MQVDIYVATSEDSATVARLVVELTREICEVMGDATQFSHNLELTERLCREWIANGIYTVLLARVRGEVVGLAAISQTHALYAEGPIGVIQECMVRPAYRRLQVGARLIEKAFELAPQKGWACLELCTPPLPQFERSLAFYQQLGFKPVGGRKMRARVSE